MSIMRCTVYTADHLHLHLHLCVQCHETASQYAQKLHMFHNASAYRSEPVTRDGVPRAVTPSPLRLCHDGSAAFPADRLTPRCVARCKYNVQACKQVDRPYRAARMSQPIKSFSTITTTLRTIRGIIL